MSGVSKNEFLHGDIRKGLLKLALPLMLLSLVNTLYNIVDTFWIGKMGELQVGAVSLIGPIMSCGNAFIFGLSAAGIAMISKAIGSGNRDKANRYATHLFFISIVFGVIIGIICLLFAHPILNWLETPIEIYQDAYLYLFGISFDFVFLFILNIFQTIRRADGDTKLAVSLNIVAAILNTILDPIFIFILDLGVLGAALATVLSKILVLPFVIYILFMDKEHVRCSLNEKFDISIIKEMIKIGVPASLGSFLSSFGFVLMNKAVVNYGAITMSAYGLGNRITDLFYIPVLAFGGAIAPFIGQNLGAKNIQRCKECYKETTILSMICSVLVISIGFVTCKYLVYFFVSDASVELLNQTLEYCYYVIFTIFCVGWFENIFGVFNASGKTNIVLYLSTFRLWGIRIPLIYIFQYFTDLGPTGIWWAMCISNGIICILGEILYRKEKWYK